MHSKILNIFGINDTDQDKDQQIVVFSAILLLNLAYLFSTEFHFNIWCQMALMNPPQPLKLKTTEDVGIAWKLFKQSWQLYEIASGTNE